MNLHRVLYVVCCTSISLACSRVPGTSHRTNSDKINNSEVDENAFSSAGFLIEPSECTHDFGYLVGSPGKSVTHHYRLVNRSSRTIRGISLLNQRPCCGDVRIDKSSLAPGESANVVVRLLIGERYGEIMNKTIVQTEPPTESPVELRTTAHALARVRFEEDSSAGGTVLLSTNPPKIVKLQVIASGTQQEPPPDLDRLSIKSPEVAWCGDKRLSRDGDLIIASRSVCVTLNPSGSIGERVTEIRLAPDSGRSYSYLVHWKVDSPISPVPRMIVLSPNREEYHILLQGHDDHPFRILDVECPSGLKWNPASSTSGRTQHLKVEAVPGTPESTDEMALIIRTDHPAQPKLSIPVSNLK